MLTERNTPEKNLNEVIKKESEKFQSYYRWLEEAMPEQFFDEVDQENIILITHNLNGFDLQDYYSPIHLKSTAIVLCLDSPDADLNILKNYAFYGIRNYQAFVSKTTPPFPQMTSLLRIAILKFTEGIEQKNIPFSLPHREEARALVRKKNPEVTEDAFDKLISGMNTRFLHSLTLDKLVMAFEMFFRAKTRDSCQYEVRYNETFEEDNTASMQIVLSWRNTPKHNFLYRMARVINRHNLVIKRVNATYINTYSTESTLVMILDLHGMNEKAAWDAASIVDFLREFLTIKYFASFDAIYTCLVSKKTISGIMGNFLRSATNFIHQTLVHVDPHLYSKENVEESLCRHPALTALLCEAFRLKFDPDFLNFEAYLKIRESFLLDVNKLDTGQEEIDTRSKNVLYQAMNFIHFTLKTNFFRTNLTAHSFRLDPQYLNETPFCRKTLFPFLPYAIFFIKGMHFFGFHIRFTDLARGGLRTVYPMNLEQVVFERNNIFSECYNLSLTQHMKNKDIPEGGAKGVIFLNPYQRLESETLVLKKELEITKLSEEDIERKIHLFEKEQKIEYLHQAQRSYIESLLILVNCAPNGSIRAKNIIDYLGYPEYLYLGPDENMHDEMIQWIANYSQRHQYKPGGAFISGKPKTGINHKEYGVTSLGVNVYMEHLLRYLGINPVENSFTIKMSGGPDGDVAGNQICNLYRYYPKTAKLLALIDASGTIYDPNGLDLGTLVELFKQSKPIKYYPPEKLSSGGFLLDKYAKRNETPFIQQTLCWRKHNHTLEEEWLSGSEMNQRLRYTVHQTKTDIFIPAGGRPKTLNKDNIEEFLDLNGKPTSKGIIEGANLYLTGEARLYLEKLGVLIIKDSSANKTGVIGSSFEVLCGLSLTDEQFMHHKSVLVQEILERLAVCASNEAKLILLTHKKTGQFLTEISTEISDRINLYTNQLLDYLNLIPWPENLNDPLVHCFLDYCLPTLRNRFSKELMEKIPENHKKAIVASYIAAQLVYQKGLGWQPSVVDILPVLLTQVTQK